MALAQRLNDFRLANVSAAGGAATVTKTAVAGRLIVVTSIIVSCSAAPAAGSRLLYDDGASTQTVAYLPLAGGTLALDFNGGWPMDAEGATAGTLTITTDVGGGAVLTSLVALGVVV